MSATWANPFGHNIIATRCCDDCDHEDVRELWSRPLDFAGSKEGLLGDETPLTIPEVAGLLLDAPFRCRGCDGSRARLVAISVDESSIPF